MAQAQRSPRPTRRASGRVLAGAERPRSRDPVDARADPRHRARAVHRAGLRQDLAARHRRAARRPPRPRSTTTSSARRTSSSSSICASTRSGARHSTSSAELEDGQAARRRVAGADRPLHRPGHRQPRARPAAPAQPQRARGSSTNNERHRPRTTTSSSSSAASSQSPAIPLAQRVRMACSIGAIVGVLATGEALFGEVPLAELAEHVRAAVHDLLKTTDEPRQTAADKATARTAAGPRQPQPTSRTA